MKIPCLKRGTLSLLISGGLWVY